MLKRKTLGFELCGSNSETLQGILAIQDIDRLTKPVVIVLVISLHNYWKLCYFDSTSSKCLARNNLFNFIYFSHDPK